MIQNLVMSVSGMKGAECERKVKSALGELEGVRKVEVDISGNLVAVAHDPYGATETQIKNAISAQGFRIS
jgi:copper chaperone CopZ